MKLSLRLLSIIGFVLLFLITYFLTGHYVIQRGIFYTPMLSWERDIPFIPWTFFTYSLVFVVPGLAFLLLTSKRELLSMFKAFVVGLVIHVLFWIFYPVKFELRPDIPIDQSGFWIVLIKAFFRLDSPPVNCFPSLHVTYAFLSYFMLHIYRPRLAPLFLFFAIIISLSTLTFKQHYVADIVAGILIALILKLIFVRGEKKRVGNSFSI